MPQIFKSQIGVQDMAEILGLILYFAILLAVMLPIGYWLDRVEKRHEARVRAEMIERYGEGPR